MSQYIVNLFQDMSMLTIALIGAGLLLCIIEVYVPKFGLAGILGIALTLLGISSYYIDGYQFKQVVSLLSIIALIMAVSIIIELILEGKGIIKNPNRYKFRNYKDQGLYSLIGRTAKAITNIDLGGTIEINGKLYYAISTSPISKDAIVEIVGVENNTLLVR